MQPDYSREFLHSIAIACGMLPTPGERYIRISGVQLLDVINGIRRQRDEANARADALSRENERLTDKLYPPRMEID